MATFNDSLTCYACGKIVMEVDAIWVMEGDDADPHHTGCLAAEELTFREQEGMV